MVIFGKDAAAQANAPEEIGGKARGLVRLMRAGAEVPAWFVLPPGHDPMGAVRAWREMAIQSSDWNRVVVRSSAIAEDGVEHSFAGMYESILGVTDADTLLTSITRCRSSANHPRVQAYLSEHRLESTPVAVIVQVMVEGDASGVMFSSDPADPDRALISSAWGLGEGVVQGTVPCDTFRVDRGGEVERIVIAKDVAISMIDGSPAEVPVPETMQLESSLSDHQARELTSVARALETALGGPQDIEWTRQGDRLVLLQTRPVTQSMPQGRRLLWDNSNIIESYHGLTGPLTYSFASRAYTIVYRLFCQVMGVHPDVIQENASVFPRMIGLIRGRIFYNLDAWYTVVSLLPGHRWNQEFMEQMMGVSEVAQPVTHTSSKWRALPSLVRSVAGLCWRAGRLDKDVIVFTQRFEDAMHAHPRDLTDTPPMGLLDVYGDLEKRLLWAWSTPIVNDFFVMIFHGLLRKLCGQWIPGGEDLHNGLLAGEGGLHSAAPAVDGLRIAQRIQDTTEWRVLFASTMSDEQLYVATQEVPALRNVLDDYLETWGDRCADELKLEVPTLRHKPEMLMATLRAYLRGGSLGTEHMGHHEKQMRLESETRAFAELSGVRKWVFRWVLVRARRRVRDRENLRFLRTRIFGRVRDLFIALGGHMNASGAIDDPRDIFWLTVDEAFGWVRGTSVTTNLRGMVALRRQEYAHWDNAPEPADRFHTWGPVWSYNQFLGRPKAPSGDGLHGLAACPGVVEGFVRRVVDPNDAGDIDGAVMVAYRTDPGWVPLFPRISAMVVERGSLLSHSAVVAREMGIPTVVSVAGAMDELQNGDRVRVDAIAGTIELLERGA
jgi:phosphohistidine swiveling domain-containing protein